MVNEDIALKLTDLRFKLFGLEASHSLRLIFGTLLESLILRLSASLCVEISILAANLRAYFITPGLLKELSFELRKWFSRSSMNVALELNIKLYGFTSRPMRSTTLVPIL